MHQQINLFKPELRERREPLSAVTMLQIGVLVLVVFGAWYGLTWWEVQSLETQQANTTERLESMRAKVAQLEANRVDEAPSKLLADEVERLTRALERREQIADTLSGGALGNTHGFSTRFEALARQHVEGSWLTGIAIHNGGDYVRLSGETLAPELVPRYLEGLLTEPVFGGLSFNMLELKTASGKRDRLSFKLATDARAENNDGSS